MTDSLILLRIFEYVSSEAQYSLPYTIFRLWSRWLLTTPIMYSISFSSHSSASLHALVINGLEHLRVCLG